jgi:hypothetical protein
MTISGGKMRVAGALALLLTLAPETLAAQTVPDFSLPRTRPTSSSGAQGPVDDDNPVVRTAPRPTPSAPPVVITPSAAPSTSSPASAVLRGPSGTLTGSVPVPSATQRPSAQAPRPGNAGPAPQVGGPAVVPASGDQAIQPTVPTDATFGAADSFAMPPVADSTAQPASSGWYWPWIAGAATLLAALFGLLWWRKRKPAVKLLEFERPIVTAPKSEAEPGPVTPSAPAPAKPVVQIAAAIVPGLSISLDARRMSASLMATTLNYVLTLTNTTDQPLNALAVEGDMIAAHGSLPADKQIAGDDQRLELRHALVTLAAGESAEFTGDFRLPLATLVPIRAGDAAYFIPLARWRVEASTAAGTPLVQVQTFVVGELPEQPGAALRPFRLDLGPRTYSRIGQRAVN